MKHFSKSRTFIFRMSLLTVLAVAVGITFVDYVGSLNYPFVGIDDDYYVVNNPGLKEFNKESIRYFFLEDKRDARYLPVTYLSYAMEVHFFGLSASAMRFTNIFIHGINALFLFTLLRMISAPVLVSFVCTTLFVVHPMQVESVVWVMGRKNVLFTAFGLLSMILYFKALYTANAGRSLLWFFLSCIALLMSVFSKTSGIMFIPVMVLATFSLEGILLSRKAKFFLAAVQISVGFIVAMTVAYVTPVSPFHKQYDLTLVEHAMIYWRNLFFYIKGAVLPSHLAVFYPLPPLIRGTFPQTFYYWAGLSFLLSVLVITYWSKLKEIERIGLVFFAVTILPQLNMITLFSDLPILAADRYFYHSGIGLFLFLSSFMCRILYFRKAPLLVLIVVSVYIAGIQFQTCNQIKVWKNTISLLKNEVRYYPSKEFYYRLAHEYFDSGDIHRSREYMVLAESSENQLFFSDFAYFHVKNALIYEVLGNVNEQFECMLKAVDAKVIEGSPFERSRGMFMYTAYLANKLGLPEKELFMLKRAKKERNGTDDFAFEKYLFHISSESACSFGSYCIENQIFKSNAGCEWLIGQCEIE